jgi:FkbM family methyltransferase
MLLADFADEAHRQISRTQLANETDAEGRRWLVVPGHARCVIPALAQKHDRFEIRLKKQPNQGFYEETATLLFSFLLTRFSPKVVLDVGAAVGHFSLLAASHLGARPAVHSFEMQPSRVEKARERAARAAGLDDRITANLSGLSDQHVGETRVWFARTLMFETRPEARDYLEPWYIRMKFALQGRDYEATRGLIEANVLLTSIEHYCAANDIMPGLVKIDVDGYEGKVLQGARRMLAEAQPAILLELHKDDKQRHGLLRRDVVAMLFNADYQALFITDHHDPRQCRLVPATADDPLFARTRTDMVLFLAPHHLGPGA